MEIEFSLLDTAVGFLKYAKLPSESPKELSSNNNGDTGSHSNGFGAGHEVTTPEKAKGQGASPDEDSKSETAPRAPDGGYGWFILLAAHCTLIFREGIAKCLGIFLPTFRSYFGVSTSLIGWVSSLCVTFADFTGLISGPLCRRFGCRPIAIAGGIFGGGGLILASLTTEVGELSVCLSLSGIGLGLALTPSLTMVGRYFDKRYSMANGLSYAGSGVGILVLAPLAQLLIDTYGWRGGLLIMGSLCFHVSTCGVLLRPLSHSTSPTRRSNKMQYKQVPADEQHSLANGDQTHVQEERPHHDSTPEVNGLHDAKRSTEDIEMQGVEGTRTRTDEDIKETSVLGDTDGTDDKMEYEEVDLEKGQAENETDSDDEVEAEAESARERCFSLLGLSLFTDVGFLILMVAQFCGRFTYMGWLIYLVPHAHDKGVEPMQATFIASVAGVSNIIARAGHGLLVDYKLLTAGQLLTIASFFSAAPMILDPFLNTYGTLIAGSLVYGLASGVFFPIAVVVVKQTIGMERFPNALGWSYGFAGIGRMSAGFLTGWLYDQFGSYNASFLMLGGIQLFASALLIVLLCMSAKKTCTSS
ncbi:monocarboxylate transporter 13-like [Diadema setosum]|uniref:monocarboxylate transporter 13-like n=1 Tax=Diadema setosum TaxID=31175 RepID=UPI003B3B9814